MRRIHKFEKSFEEARGSAVIRYSVATGFVLAAFAVRLSLDNILGEHLPFTFFLTSAILATWFGGMGPGFYAVILGMLLGDYFFLPPIGTLGEYRPVEWILVFAEAVPEVLAVLLIEFLHRTRRRLQHQTDELKNQIRHRQKIEAELSHARDQLNNYARQLENRVHERTIELQQSVKFLEGYCYSMAHELRAPVRAIQGFVEILKEEYAPALGRSGKDYSERIVDAARRLDRLIFALLEYGRLSHVDVHFEGIEVDSLLADILNEMPATTCSVKIRIKPAGLTVWGDRQLLKQSIREMISNALKFPRPGEPPHVRIGATEKNGSVRIFVEDRGLGIAPEHQEKVFGAFERLNLQDSSGTGMGLAIVSKAAERMKGRVGVESQPGQGSCFWIDLPKAEKRGQSHSTPNHKQLTTHR